MSRAVFCLALLSLSLLSACRVKNLDDAVFACTQDVDCAPGERCLEHICRSPASLDGGGPEEGNCSQSCAAEHKMCCGTSCVDLASDSRNCGKCGVTCDDGESCRAGVCAKENVCDNNIDDNNDGLIDCQDTSSCPDSTACYGGGRCCHAACVLENTAELCSNNQDDDCDGLTDCAEASCHGQPCGAGKICTPDGQCVAGCFIDGKYYNPGETNADAPCLVCNPAQSMSDWSPAAAGSISGRCSGLRACDDNGQCRRATGQPCGGNGDCAMKSCAAGFCL